ncbi:acyl-CoA synthetase (AMP-forming)/AMP-acid ligase II [Streptomyces canus]|nr:acyl-CoA synthetase (AMP-forming)/AMP-acid ligase II [Streptomyces canus]
MTTTPQVVLYTSGATGWPKGAELRHRNVYDNTLAGVDLFAADFARPDTYCVSPSAGPRPRGRWIRTGGGRLSPAGR